MTKTDHGKKGKSDIAETVTQEQEEISEPGAAKKAPEGEKAQVQAATTPSEEIIHELIALSNDLTELSKRLSARLTRSLAPILSRMEAIYDLQEILESETVLVVEEKCLRCMRVQGEPHGRGACAALARVQAAKVLLNARSIPGKE